MKKTLFLGFLKSTAAYAKTHKFVSAAVILVLVGAGYLAYSAFSGGGAETRYVLGAAEKGTLIVSVSGSGQVSASNQVILKSKASGDVLYISVKNGDEVHAGATILGIDSRDAGKTVRDAEVNYESAKLSLDKLKRPADTLSMLQAENALSQAESDLNKGYDDGFNAVSGAFLDLPGVMTGVEDILYGNDVSKSALQDNISAYSDMVYSYDENVLKFKDDAAAKYRSAREAFDGAFLAYRSLARTSDKEAVEKITQDAYVATKIVADSVKSAGDLLWFVNDKLNTRNSNIPAILATHQSLLQSYTSKINTHLGALLSANESLVSSKYSIKEKTESLAELKAGADAIDIQSAELTLKSRENALLDAREKLADYVIRAPFDGTIATLDVKKYDPVSSATAVATLITKQKLAEVSLNEVDASKVKVGQKVNLTFDAIENLGITGSVAEIDTIGAVAQGVVTYNVTIGFDTQDERVKSGMSVSAAIITEAKPDVLLVPNSAVKIEGGESYVEVFDAPIAESGGNQGVTSAMLPSRLMVEVGLSNDISTEIISGLAEGGQIVTRTIQASTQTAAQTAPSLFPTGGARQGAGGTRTLR